MTVTRAHRSFAKPEEIGHFIAVMLSGKQGGMHFMTGSDVVIDGGELFRDYIDLGATTRE